MAIVGAGPAGLALSTHLARQGVSTIVFERDGLPRDKACGEGLMPAGLWELEQLGARALLNEEDASPIEGIRYLQEDGTRVEGRLQAPGGLGVRRLALSRALLQTARAAGAVVRERARVETVQANGRQAELRWSGGRCTADVVVAADGLLSPLRREVGLEERFDRTGRRYGVRQHFAMEPWTTMVEVHFAEGVEAYVTPCGRHRVGVAFLFDADMVGASVSFGALLARFPALEGRLTDQPIDSQQRGAGPLEQRVHGLVAERVALLGDAAGYVDAITGEGLTLGLRGAAILAEVLPEALARGAASSALLAYEVRFRREYARYEAFARLILGIARQPPLRRWLVRRLAGAPALFERTVQWVIQ